MSIATLNPWQVLDQLQQDALRRHSGPTSRNAASPSCKTTQTRQWHPAVDISESVNGFHIVMDLPGIKPEDATIEIEDQLLKISGERKQPETATLKKHHKERVSGAFSRQFRLPKDADATQVNASFEVGVLTININKQEESKPRKVTITTTG
ncbi:MAG: Hsp20/alpha crystallin family protein [Pseudomonadales bacterium]|nr:Hsp20/alpha crystallin family protein [Pseudomonadales bacterium]